MNGDTLYKGSGGKAVTTFLELAKAAGWGTGVVTTTRITHATPASTYAHINDRDNEDAIATQLTVGGDGYNAALGDGVDVVFGGGARHFLPESNAPDGGRKDGRDLVAELKAKFFLDKGLQNIPKRCKVCVALYKEKLHEKHPVFSIKCRSCGKKAEVTFEMVNDDVLCEKCFNREIEKRNKAIIALGEKVPE
jgi:hypothetical protein